MEMQSLGQVLSRQNPGTGSVQRFGKRRPCSQPTTLAECDALTAWATETSRGPDRATPEQIINHLEFLKASLPSQNQDFASGAMRASVLVGILSDYSDNALAHMVQAAIRHLDWFPTPKQCVELLADFREPPSEQAQALRLCHDFRQNSFERWMDNIAAGQPIGDVPEQWLRIAVERGTMRRLSNGSFVSRALYHGPVKPVLTLVAS